MTQTVSVLVITNSDYEVVEFFPCAPNSEEVEAIAKSYGICGEVTCEYESYFIGGGANFFFTEEELRWFYNNGDWITLIKKAAYEIKNYDNGNFDLIVTE